MSKKNRGQSLWEVIIALGIAGLVALGLVRATSSSVKSTRFAADQSRLSALAQKRLAEVIEYKNRKGPDFWGVGFPLQPGQMGILGQELPVDEDYCLFTKITNATGDLPASAPAGSLMARIEVTVFWESQGEGSDCSETKFNHKLIFSTNVTNY